MAKGTPVTKLVNGEIADALVLNQIIEDVGSQGGLIPYDPSTNNQETNGSQSIGSTAFPWGSLFINKNANLVEVDPSTNTASANIAWSLLRTFLGLKDAPSSYTGFGGDAITVKLDETGLQFTPPSDIPKNIQVFTSSGTWTRPTGINIVYVKVVGGGGNGSVSSTNPVAGGGGGGYSEGLIAVTGNVSVTIGSTNSFAGSTTISATKGTNASSVTAGIGGSGSGGTINVNGAGGQGNVFGAMGGGTVMGSGGGGANGNSAGNGIMGGGGGGATGSSVTAGTGDVGAVIIYW